MQGVPSFEHPPQKPFSQIWLQHCAGSKQLAPRGTHSSAQMPSAHRNEQHCSGDAHGEPATPQVPEPQTPFSQTALQHSSGDAQGAKSGRHVAGPQEPSVHEWLQHWLFWPQGAPSGKHVVPPHVPSTQVPLQQLVAALHGSPSPWQPVVVPPDPPLPPVPVAVLPCGPPSYSSARAPQPSGITGARTRSKPRGARARRIQRGTRGG